MADYPIEDPEHGGHEHHVVQPLVYYKVFAALMVLLVATCWAAAYDLGPLNTIIAMIIAVVKAGLIVLFFMHIKFSSKLAKVFAVAALFWLTILFALSLQDYFTRAGMSLPKM